ncbi:MAG: hypothetical protein U9O56_03080 [Campylobacterota bacterium]|nr:hypothetical protein [Campylobacterota bacterium]
MFFYFAFITKESQVLLSIVFIIVAFITLFKTSYIGKKETKPKLSRCLYKANFLETFFIPILFNLSAYIVVFYLADFILVEGISKGVLSLISVLLIVISTAWYFRCCEKYGVLDDE